MQNILIDRPYTFIPPHAGRWWPRLLHRLAGPMLRYQHGVAELECRGLERLAASLREGRGVLLAPNHSRPCDPILVTEAARRAGGITHTLGSAHLFMQSRLQRWLLLRAGAFPIYREGMDKAAVNASIDILVAGERPLVLFPEGIITRTNERLNHLMEGTAFIARMAARKRAKSSPAGSVVVHPVALRYKFRGDIDRAVAPTLSELETRLSWRPQSDAPTIERILKIGDALLGLKESEYFGKPQEGPVPERLERLIDRLLAPLEREWLGGAREAGTPARVKKLRMAILPDIVKGEVDDAERERRWRQLADTYLAQQLSCYPPDYVRSDPSPERILETVERFEEDLTDVCRVYSPMKAIVEIGEPLVVSEERPKEGGDPLMAELERRLKEMLGALK